MLHAAPYTCFTVMKWAEWSPRILSNCKYEGLKVVLWERACLSKRIYMNEKCVYCSGLRELDLSPHSSPLFLPFTFVLIHTNMHAHVHITAYFQCSHSFYSPNSDCEMTLYFNQLYLICTLAEDRATCVLLLPWLAMSMPTGRLWAALDCHAWQSLRSIRRVRLQSVPLS